jgi:hypothetical protein
MQAASRHGARRRRIRERSWLWWWTQIEGLRSVRPMTAPLPGPLASGESDLQTAQSEVDPYRQGQYARSALDAAAEVAWDCDASAEDRDRAVAIMRSSLELTPRPDPDTLLRDAQNMLTEARGEAEPHRRRELARSALAKARAAMRHRGVDDQQRAQARQVIGAGRMIVNTGGGGRDASAQGSARA